MISLLIHGIGNMPLHNSLLTSKVATVTLANGYKQTIDMLDVPQKLLSWQVEAINEYEEPLPPPDTTEYNSRDW